MSMVTVVTVGVSVQLPSAAFAAPGLPWGASLAMPAGAVVKGAEAGYLPGVMKVTPTGQATYEIPLEVPAGPNKMQPSLGLHYSSGAGNGLLGVGWTVGGLSSIDRGGKRVASEGRQTGVKFKNSDTAEGDADRFTLDGHKLIAVKGAYGADGTEYRTETESFTKVISHGAGDAGPEWFEVWTKDGLKKEYRAKEAPRLDWNGTGLEKVADVRFSYPLAKATDRSGNVIEYTYTLTPSGTGDAHGVELRPHSISYSSVSGTERLRYVEFKYGKRPDKTFSWLSGVRLERNERLTDIEMHGPSPRSTGLLWSYHLDYDDDSRTKRSLLKSVTKIGAQGGRTLARTFKYSKNGIKWNPKTVENEVDPDPKRSNIYMTQPADFNGDGADDLLYLEASGSYPLYEYDATALMSGDCAAACDPLADKQTISDRGDFHKWQHLQNSRVVDLDGDGVAELVAHGKWDAGWQVLHWNQTSSTFEAGGSDGFSHQAIVDIYSEVNFGDVNGDQLPDLIRVGADRTRPHSHRYKVYLNTGSTFSSTPIDTGIGRNDALVDPSAPRRNLDIVDTDADGRVELAGGWYEDEKVFTLRDDGSPLIRDPDETWSRNIGRLTSQMGDVNGDGVKDVVRLKATGGVPGGGVFVYYGTGYGYGFTPGERLFSTPDWPANSLRFADVDGDSRDDIIVFHSRVHFDDRSWPWGDYIGATILFASGERQDLEGLADPEVVIVGRGGIGDYTDNFDLPRIGDFNNDGRIDFTSYKKGASRSDGEYRVIENLPSSEKGAMGQGNDLLMEVSDAPVNAADAALWPRERVTYSAEWSNQPRQVPLAAHANAFEFPTVPVRRRGMMVARKVETFRAADPADRADVKPYVMDYSFEHPVQDLQGRGFLGFDRMTVFESNQHETVTYFDNRHRSAVEGHPERHWYPLSGLPIAVRTVAPVEKNRLKAQQGQTPNVRVSKTLYRYEQVNLHGGAVHYSRPAAPKPSPAVHTTDTVEWEQAAKFDPDLSDSGNTERPREHFFGLRGGSLQEGMPDEHYRRVWVDETRDEFNNVTSSRSQVEGKTADEDGGMTLTETEFDHSAARNGAWLLSIPKKVISTKSEKSNAPAGELTSKKTVEFEFDEKGRQHIEWVERNAATADNDLKSTTTTEYGDAGEVVSVKKETGTPDTPVRVTHFEYTPLVPGWPAEKIHQTQVWSDHATGAVAPPGARDLRPSVWTLTHPGLGVPMATLDANGAKSVMKYDDLGRIVSATPAGGSETTTGYAMRADASGGVNGTVVTTTHKEGAKAQVSTESTDNTGRTLRTTGTDRTGATVAVDTRYDELGRVRQVSRPYTGTAPSKWTVTGYDTLDRPRLVTGPDGKSSKMEYPDVFTARTTDAKDNVSYTTVDLTGRTVTSGKVVDAGDPSKDVKVTFTQGPSGPLKIVDPRNTTTTAYDALGRLTQAKDANTGTTKYKYNGFGEQRETEAAGGKDVSVFDDLGRVTTVTHFGTSGAATGTTTTVWDTATGGGIGKPAHTTSRDGIKTVYRYDSIGRPVGTDYQDGTTLYKTDTTYDAHGRVETLSYPEVAGRTDRFKIKNTYNPYTGQVEEVADSSAGRAPKMLWKTTGQNTDGNITTGSYGTDALTTTRTYNGDTGRLESITDTNRARTKLTETAYEYYDNGALKRRNDTLAGRDATYTYDTLNRLTDWTLTRARTLPAQRLTHYDYNTAGDLTTIKVDGTTTETNHYNDTAHPSAVTGHTDRTTRPTTSLTYTYDEQGRQKVSAGRTLTYKGTSLTPSTITQGSTTWNLTYDAAGNRFKKTDGNRTTTYIGDFYERRDTRTPAGTAHVFHVNGPAGHIAQITYTGATVIDTKYTLNDPQGTNTTTTDNNGNNPQEQYFDPFGRRINTAGTPTPIPTTPTGITRGYTGHEMDDEYNLINMKGRLYDPITKLFTTPDPHITHPHNPLNYNPYTYTLNNPTNHTDPTGYDPSDGGIDGVQTTHIEFLPETVQANGQTITGTNTITLYGNAAISTETLYQQVSTQGFEKAMSADISENAEITHPVAMAAARSAVRLMCGKSCSAANAPTSEETAALAEKSLSAGQHLENAYSTATLIYGKPTKFLPSMQGVLGAASNLTLPEPTDTSTALITSQDRYPPWDGFDLNHREIVTLEPGEKIDRYNSDYGAYYSPEGVSHEARSLFPMNGPYGSPGYRYSVFEVKKPFDVQAGPAAPYYGQPGGGVQYYVPGTTTKQLMNDGHLEREYMVEFEEIELGDDEYEEWFGTP